MKGYLPRVPANSLKRPLCALGCSPSVWEWQKIHPPSLLDDSGVVGPFMPVTAGLCPHRGFDGCGSNGAGGFSSLRSPWLGLVVEGGSGGCGGQSFPQHQSYWQNSGGW